MKSKIQEGAISPKFFRYWTPLCIGGLYRRKFFSKLRRFSAILPPPLYFIIRYFQWFPPTHFSYQMIGIFKTVDQKCILLEWISSKNQKFQFLKYKDYNYSDMTLKGQPGRTGSGQNFRQSTLNGSAVATKRKFEIKSFLIHFSTSTVKKDIK